MKCHLLLLTYWSWEGFENGKGEAEGGEREGGCERNSFCRIFIALRQRRRKHVKTPILKFLKHKWKCHCFFFLFFFWSGFAKKFILEEKFNKIIYQFFPSCNCCGVNNITWQQLFLYAAADKTYVFLRILAPSFTASQVVLLSVLGLEHGDFGKQRRNPSLYVAQWGMLPYSILLISLGSFSVRWIPWQSVLVWRELTASTLQQK